MADIEKTDCKVAVVGASGFIGMKLVNYLIAETNCSILALSRNPISIDAVSDSDRFSWHAVDLHNLLSLEESLQGVHIAIYLVHSMLPSARLNQGTFTDFDLSLADNFGRAAKQAGVEQVVYLSGLIPDHGELSPHLQSRREVEDVLRNYIPELTTIRAGLIMGEGGSSFTIMYRLVQRLPVMLCPSWTKSICQPIFIDDVIRSIAYCIRRKDCYGKIFDVGSPERWTYLELMMKTADLLHKKIRFLVVPVFTPKLSRLWVSVVAQAPKSLAYPLIQSLREDMTTHPERLLKLPDGEFLGVNETLNLVLERFESLQKSSVSDTPHAFKKGSDQSKQKSVRSIQRLTLPPGKSAEWVAKQYMLWLQEFFSGLLMVVVEDTMVYFRLKGFGTNLLILRYSPERSQSDRQLFYVDGGILSSRGNVRGRLELRETLGGRAIIAALHDFVPALPWYLYRLSQAKMHAFVMAKFNQFLLKSGSLPADTKSLIRNGN